MDVFQYTVGNIEVLSELKDSILAVTNNLSNCLGEQN